MKDFLIVGFGLAGMSMASVLERRERSFRVIDTPTPDAHRVIGGMYNPVILKRFSPAWQAHEMWQQSVETYRWFEQKFQQTFIKPFDIYRILHSVEEQNNWVVASDKAVMNQYMLTPVKDNFIHGIEAPYGLGQLHNVGRVEGELILAHYEKYLKEQQLLLDETFDYDDLVIKDDHVDYQGEIYRHVIFAEGSYISHNPFFNYLPMKVSKGEMLIIHVPDLSLNDTIKSKVFMVPLGQQLFIVGSTYHWDDTTHLLTVKGQQELESKLKKFLKLPYTVLDYKAGVRPTVSDRRPLLGQHPQYQPLFVLNGLGTRGIIYAPALAEILYEMITSHKPVDEAMHIDRFKQHYQYQ